MDDTAGKNNIQRPPQEQLVHVNLAPTSLGFQLGETLQIMSKGKFTATPHAVKAPPTSTATNTNTAAVGRASLAVFLQPLANQVLPPLVANKKNENDQDNDHDDEDSFSLQRRWRSTFGEFQRVTVESFS